MLSREKRMRLWTYLLDPPVLAMLTFIFFYLMKPAERNIGACLTGVVCLGLVPLSAWFHMVRHPADFAGERKVGFVLSIAGYVVGTLVMLIFFRSSRLNMAFMLSYLFTVVGLTTVNLMHYKASGHASGAAGPATALTIVYGWPGAISFLLLVAVAVAKINIKEHTLGQLCTGASLSVASTLAGFAIMGLLHF
ncbi:MAG TPA: hypothetical protein VN478_05750 [Clostridia bacterium]|nr:hypothetical protein [Clostridia bacterium]